MTILTATPPNQLRPAGGHSTPAEGYVMNNGLAAMLQKHAEELEVERAAHRDALALCEVYEQRIAALEAAPLGRVPGWEPVPEELRYIMWRYSQDHKGEDHQQRHKVASAWLASVGQEPLHIYECICHAAEDGYPIGTVILAATNEVQAMAICGQSVGADTPIKIREWIDVFAHGSPRILWNSVGTRSPQKSA
jgi:hypothetical protein